MIHLSDVGRGGRDGHDRLPGSKTLCDRWTRPILLFRGSASRVRVWSSRPTGSMKARNPGGGVVDERRPRPVRCLMRLVLKQRQPANPGHVGSRSHRLIEATPSRNRFLILCHILTRFVCLASRSLDALVIEVSWATPLPRREPLDRDNDLHFPHIKSLRSPALPLPLVRPIPLRCVDSSKGRDFH